MSRKPPKPAALPPVTAETTLLELLQRGVKITFAGEYYLHGDAKDRDIHVGTQFGSDGYWTMDAKGVGDAVADISRMAERDGYDLAGNRIGDPVE